MSQLDESLNPLPTDRWFWISYLPLRLCTFSWIATGTSWSCSTGPVLSACAIQCTCFPVRCLSSSTSLEDLCLLPLPGHRSERVPGKGSKPTDRLGGGGLAASKSAQVPRIRLVAGMLLSVKNPQIAKLDLTHIPKTVSQIDH